MVGNALVADSVVEEVEQVLEGVGAPQRPKDESENSHVVEAVLGLLKGPGNGLEEVDRLDSLEARQTPVADHREHAGDESESHELLEVLEEWRVAEEVELERSRHFIQSPPVAPLTGND